MKTWIEPQEIAVPAQLQAAVGGHPLVAYTLARRGIREAGAARAFLDAREYQPAAPTELPGMRLAVDRLAEALSQGETICVWGDFDVDGQTATTLLVSALRRLGGKVIYHIPVRASESHGINLDVLRQLLETGQLSSRGVLLTCDTGISANAAVEYAQVQGVDVVITDHHDLPPNLPPALAVVNPKLLPSTHPLAGLPGVGVAYKLAEALYQRFGLERECESFLDLAALGIVADLATQTGEVRYLLQRGLQTLRRAQRMGLRLIMELAELDPAWLTEEHISYILAPRLNALGRLADANPVVEFLSTSDEAQARPLALEMEALNPRRRLLTEQVFHAALSQIEQDASLLEQPVLVLAHAMWPAGVIGIVASQLVERFGKPTVLLSSPPGELARGSARSVEGINITAAIAAQADILAGFGGHPMAAGLAISPEHIPDFRRRLARTIREMVGEARLETTLQIDGYLPLSALSLELVCDLERLAPFGPGNPRLVLAAPRLRLTGYASVGRNEEHLLLKVEDENEQAQRVIWWQGANWPLPDGLFDLAYSVRSSNYRGQRDVQVEWVDARPVGGEAIELRRPAFEVVDYRRHPDAAQLLQQFQAMPDVQIWGETQPGCLDRRALRTGKTLVIWTAPPGRAELSQVLEQVQPEKIYLVGVDPAMDQPETFLRQLVGMLKHALKREQGVADIQRLAAATAQRPAAVRAGINWLQARGYIRVVEQAGDFLRLAQGDGTPTAELAQARQVLKRTLEESAAFRTFFRKADPKALLEMPDDG